MRELSTRPNRVVCCFGNEYTPAETITTFIDALHPTLRSYNVCFRDSNRDITYLDNTYFAQQEKDAVCACTRAPGPKRPQQMDARTQDLALAEPNNSESDQEKELMLDVPQIRQCFVWSPQILYMKDRNQMERPR